MRLKVAELRKRQVLIGPALFLCLLLAGCSGSDAPLHEVSGDTETSPQTCQVNPATLQRRSVARVIDGDTLRLAGGDSLRLVGVNTSEIGRDGEPDEPLARVYDADGNDVPETGSRKGHVTGTFFHLIARDVA